MHPSQGSCVSKLSRCGAVRIFNAADEPSAGIVRVETLSLWRRANCQARRGTFSLFAACGSAGAWSVLRILFGINDLLVVFGVRERWRVESPTNSVWNRRLSCC